MNHIEICNNVEPHHLGANRKHELFIHADWISNLLEIKVETLNKLAVEIWNEPKTEYTKWDILAMLYYFGSLNTKISHRLTNGLHLVANLFRDALPEEEKKTFILNKASVVDCCNQRLILEWSEKGIVHSWVSANLVSKYPNSKLVPVKPIQLKRPDFLININEIIYPVECKLTFNNAGLRQLQNYMRLWKVDKGIAVATKLTINLPSNIDFYYADEEREQLLLD